MRLIAAAALWAGCLCLPTHAADDAPGSFHALFGPLTSGDCVAIAKVRAAGMTVTLTPEQFQFVRAFYMATPPVSRELPVGDKAFLAKFANGEMAFGLFDEGVGQVCAAFEASDWLATIVDAVGRGEVGKRGKPL